MGDTVGAVQGVGDRDPLLHQPDRRQHRLLCAQSLQGVPGGRVTRNGAQVA